MHPLRTALINRNYARLWYGQAISTVGDYMFDTTVVLSWLPALPRAAGPPSTGRGPRCPGDR
jgi:hypothetical protein